MVLDRCKENTTKPCEYHFTRRAIREFSGWSDFQVKTHIKQLEELEYVFAVLGRKGKQYVYELLLTDQISDDRPILVGLTDIKQLKSKIRHQSGGIKAAKAGITDQ